MKKILIIAAVLATACHVHAQGQFAFTTLGASTGLIYIDTVGGAKANGYSVDYAYSMTANVTDPALLTSAPVAQVKTINASGIFIGTVQNFGGPTPTAGLPTAGATTISLQIRAWFSGTGDTTYASAVADPLGDRYGSTLPFNLSLGDPTASPPGSATPIKNAFPSFAAVVNTPEPSTIALGMMGAAALFPPS